ncbi:MAG: hypothetical protein HZR80_16560 [Candidatus Heimdallarchaeota archaeon]
MSKSSDTTMGTVSLIFAILGCVQVLPCVGPLIAIITGYMSKGTAGESNGRIGRILGWLMILAPLIVFGIWVILVFVLWGGSWWPWP